MANPPFNVDGVQLAKIKGQIGNRLPFGAPGTTGKSKKNESGETISNANSLWIQYFYSYLNDTGRAGFVMASSASDAGNKDKEIRQLLVETGHVDVMMSIGTKFFYTRSLPCTLWFFDKGKPADLQDTVLMIDARNVYTVVSARSHVFTEEQLANLTAITWLYRGEHDKFIELLARYQNDAGQWLARLPERLAEDSAKVAALAKLLSDFGKATADVKAIAVVRNKLGEEHGLTDALLAGYREELDKAQSQSGEWQAALQAALDAAAPLASALAKAGDSVKSRKAMQAKLEAINPVLKTALAMLEARHKAWLKLLELAEKQLRARQWAGFDGDVAREVRKALLPRDTKKREKPTVRDQAMEALKRANYFITQGHWLLTRFPEGRYEDVPGLCKAVTRDEIAANDYSLTPGRYVGVSVGGQDDDDGEVFWTRMKEIHEDLTELNDKAAMLAKSIQAVFEEFVE